MTPDAPSRETWLQALAEDMRGWFRAEGLAVPPPVRISVGFTSKGARSNRIGECWYSHAVEDGIPAIFLHPKLTTAEDVGATLLHELVHAAEGPTAKHGAPFKRAATRLGLTGRMTATTATPELAERITASAAVLGPFPHAGIVAASGTTSIGPKQTTRMLKVACPVDGYVARVARSWLDHGAPICPICHNPLEEQ